MWAPAARSVKNPAVFRADSFSATAVVTNWLILVPSARLTSATAALNDAGSRKG